MYTRFARVIQALASELLNPNTHIEPLLHGRYSISNKSLPRDSFLAAEIGGALSFLATLRQINLRLRTIFESPCKNCSAINFSLAYQSEFDFTIHAFLLHTLLYKTEVTHTHTRTEMFC